MEFFKGFNWAVPKAFADALSTCHFNEGDVLYDTSKAYNSDWAQAQLNIHYRIEVKKPSSQNSASEGYHSVFEKNWHSPVDIELVDFRNSSKTTHFHTSHGRIFSTLWHGDISLLDANQSVPKRPEQIRAAHKNLSQTRPFARKLANGKPVFVMLKDTSNRASIIKHMSVKAALHREFGATPHNHSMTNAGMKNSNVYSPTIEVVFYVLEHGSEKSINDVLKKNLYVKPKTKGTEKKPDRFRLSSHGLLIAI